MCVAIGIGFDIDNSRPISGKFGDADWATARRKVGCNTLCDFALIEIICTCFTKTA